MLLSSTKQIFVRGGGQHISRLTISVSKTDHPPGSANATVLEYGDYECAFYGQAYHTIKKSNKI